MFSSDISNKIVLALILCIGWGVLSGCKVSTQVSGTVKDQAGKTLDDVSVTLRHTEQLTKTVQSDAQGRYDVVLEEHCFVICAGGNPTLLAHRDGYSTAETYVPQLKKSKHDFVLILSAIENHNTSGIYGLDEPFCTRYGGQMNVDHNSVKYCDFGKVLAAFECAGPTGELELIRIIARSEQEILINRSSGSYETLLYSPSGSGEKYVGEHLTFWNKGETARLITASGQSACHIVKG